MLVSGVLCLPLKLAESHLSPGTAHTKHITITDLNMGRRDRSPGLPPPPPMGHQPEPTYYFDNYENGKPKWAPGVDNQRDYRDYRDSRRDHLRSRKYDRDDAPPPRGVPQPPYPDWRDSHRRRPSRRRESYSDSSDSDSLPPRRTYRHSQPPRDESSRFRDRDRRNREHDSYDSYDEHYPPRRHREDNRAPRDGYKSEGYKSDGYKFDHRRKDPHDDRSRNPSRRGDRDRRNRDRDGHRDDRYDDMFLSSRRDGRDKRDRYHEDDRYRNGDRRRSDGRALAKSGQPEWQRQAMAMFKDYAIPIIKKEGVKYVQKQMMNMGKR